MYRWTIFGRMAYTKLLALPVGSGSSRCSAQALFTHYSPISLLRPCSLCLIIIRCCVSILVPLCRWYVPTRDWLVTEIGAARGIVPPNRFTLKKDPCLCPNNNSSHTPLHSDSNPSDVTVRSACLLYFLHALNILYLARFPVVERESVGPELQNR